MNYYGSLFQTDNNRLKTLSRSEMLIYTTLIVNGGKDRSFSASHKTISDRSGVSIGSVKRALKKFEALGWLSSETYYQVKKYHLLHSEEEEDQTDQDQKVDHSCELQENKKVAQSHELHLGQHDELHLGQLDDLHVIKKNNKETNSLHDMLEGDERVFMNFLSRWSELQNWNTENKASLLQDYRRMKSETSSLVHIVEIQLIDSWLLMKYFHDPSRCWKSNFMGKIGFWFQNQILQGTRTSTKKARLSSLQKHYLNFAVNGSDIPEPRKHGSSFVSQEQPEREDNGFEKNLSKPCFSAEEPAFEAVDLETEDLYLELMRKLGKA